MESMNETTKKDFKLNFYTWNLITTFTIVIINVACYNLHCFTYGSFTWMILFDRKWSNLLMVNIAIPLVYIVLYNSICWGVWKISGIVEVCIFVLYYMFLLEHFDLPINFIVPVYVGAYIYSIFFITLFDKPGGMADALFDKIFPIEESAPIQSEYGSTTLSISNYYDENADKYNVLMEQVDYMLTYEISDRSSTQNKSLYDDTINESEEETSISLSNPEDNPLHSDNVHVDKRERDKDILKYIETSLVSDFKADYQRAILSRENGNKDYLLYSGMDVERVMREYIDKYFEYEMLLKYTMIALYKTPNYQSFSIRASRRFITQYIFCNVCGYKEFFDDLLELLQESAIYDFAISDNNEG